VDDVAWSAAPEAPYRTIEPTGLRRVKKSFCDLYPCTERSFPASVLALPKMPETKISDIAQRIGLITPNQYRYLNLQISAKDGEEKNLATNT
jgi:hypothetical protein